MLDATRREAILQRSRTAPCVTALGLEFLEFDDGFCRLSARHDPRFDGVLPGFHGGMLANVADCVAWFAIATLNGPDETLVTSDLSVRYLAPCMTDVVANARVIKLGKTLCPVAIEMFDLSGKLVAVAQVTYFRVSD
ncbi:hypothetical protein RAS1_39610 [Phycisphaerae bacterium RAS1]|nr:hypothetical protein RAS1_39610 [Phycisphaerae bacterium RAS1]